jgi:hypothetical protein
MERTLVDIINSFLRKFGHDNGGSIRSDQGGELAKSPALADMVLREHNYVFEPTGANSPSQNGGVETSINAIQMEDSNGYGYPFTPVENDKRTGKREPAMMLWALIGAIMGCKAVQGNRRKEATVLIKWMGGSPSYPSLFEICKIC